MSSGTEHPKAPMHYAEEVVRESMGQHKIVKHNANLFEVVQTRTKQYETMKSCAGLYEVVRSIIEQYKKVQCTTRVERKYLGVHASNTKLLLPSKSACRTPRCKRKVK